MEKHRSYKTFTPRTAQGLYPQQVAQAANIPVVDCTGRTGGILELGGAVNKADIIAICKQFGFPVPILTEQFIDGAKALSDPGGADGEVALDVSIMALVARGAHIVIVYAPNSDQGFVDGLNALLALNCDSISISWGSPEDGWDPKILAELESCINKAAQRGCNTFVAAGDNGSSDGEFLGKVVDAPACCPSAIAVGGTHLEVNSDGSRLTETVWGGLGSNGATGGGISKVFGTTPNWQTGTVPGEPAGRRVPDIAFDADPATGYMVPVAGEVQQIGGTSGAAPMAASLNMVLFAQAGKHIGNWHTRFQQNPDAFFDVTEGTNGAYRAGPGFDCCSGWGVPDGKKLAAVLQKPLANV